MLNKKVKLFSALACLAVVAGTYFVPVSAASVSTASNFNIEATVNADGVRLRSIPATGAILELMYKGETVLIDSVDLSDQIGNGWMHVQRVQTGTIGYCDAHYVGY